MIEPVNNANPLINKDNIYFYESISISPNEIKTIDLPYKITNNYKYISFQISKKLALDGISVLWSNLNEESSKESLQFVIMNCRIAENMSDLEKIIGSRLKLTMKPSSEFGRLIFIQ